MKKCLTCGETFEDDSLEICPLCGAALEAVEAPAEEVAEAPAEEVAEAAVEEVAAEEAPVEEAKEEKPAEEKKEESDFGAMLNDKLMNTKDETESFEKEDIENYKVMGILSYIWILFLVPLFAAQNSKFAKFHCNQGIILAIVTIPAEIILGLLCMIPYVGWLFGTLTGLVGLVNLLLMLFGIVNAATGKAKELPFIGGLFKIVKY